MSEQQTEPSAGTLIVQLEGVRRIREAKERGLQAWKVLTQSYGIPDAYTVVDYAIEHELVQPCVSADTSKHGGQAPADTISWVNPLDGSEMIWIPPGPFLVGAKNERAESGGFSLARYPVTNEQFERFLNESGYTLAGDDPEPALFLHHWGRSGCPKALKLHPVVWVSFVDALAYCRWAGGTLPTEWLWEKAARGPDGRPFPWGEDFPFGNRLIGPLANVKSNGTVPVGSFPRVRTPYGCEDLIGNVSEWCQMTDSDNYGEVPQTWPNLRSKKRGEAVYQAVRGSCFLRTSLQGMKAHHRRRLSAQRRNQWVGFRLACMLPCRPLELAQGQ
jgi:serine/threonine-protein kinase